MEPSPNKTSVFLGNDQQNFPEPLRAYGNSAKMYGTSYIFQEENATGGTSFVQSDPGRSTRQFPSSTHHIYTNCGYEKAPTQLIEEDLTTRLSQSSLHPLSFK